MAQESEDSPLPKLGVRKDHPIWNFFDSVTTTNSGLESRCKECEHPVRFAVSKAINLERHLKRKHADAFEKLEDLRLKRSAKAPTKKYAEKRMRTGSSLGRHHSPALATMASVEFHFEGKSALVTGAGRGMGRATAVALHKAGAQVYALSKTEENLDSLKEECPGVTTICVDLHDWDAISAALDNLPPIELLVNNAGGGAHIPFLDTSKSDYDTIMSVNARQVFNVSQVIARKLVDSGRKGSIVCVSSVASKTALATQTVYCGAKAALDMMCRAMATELAAHGIRVNTVNPTVVWTDLGKRLYADGDKAQRVRNRIPMGRFCEIDEVVNAILFLLSDGASFVTGTSLPVDGGLLA